MELFKKCQNLLLGRQMVVYTNHKNLMHELTNNTSHHKLQKYIFIKEFVVNIYFIECEAKKVADTLLHLTTTPNIEPFDVMCIKDFNLEQNDAGTCSIRLKYISENQCNH